MKLWATIGTLMSLLASGALPPDASVDEAPDSREARPAAPGHAFEGPGFYVWDEDEHEAESWAGELASVATVHPDA